MSKVYSKKEKAPPNIAFDKLSKDVAALTKKVNTQHRTILKLDKANKYLRDRMSNAEHKLNYFTRVINVLEANVNRVMGIFRN